MKLKVTNSEGLKGTIEISGSKNAALPMIAASLLSKKQVVIKNIPLITDVLLMIEIIKSMGVNVKRDKNKLIISAKNFNPIITSNDVTKLRGSYYLIGVCLARYNICNIKFPGGCNFTTRPIDYHLYAFEKLGYKAIINNDILSIKKNEATTNQILFKKQSVGATLNACFAGCLLNQEIMISNYSKEPEVLETLKFLKKLGINIIINDNHLILDGYKKIKRVKHKVMSDRIEAGSYMILAATTFNSIIKIKYAPISYMKSIITVLKKLGTKITIKNNDLVVESNTLIKNLDLVINEYPSFPTDLQQVITPLLLKAKGQSTIIDNIYPERISHIKELKKLNANITADKKKITIYGSKLHGNYVYATDLRCAFCLVVAGCITQGETIIDNAELLLRGYEKPLIKLKKIGVKIIEYIN